MRITNETLKELYAVLDSKSLTPGDLKQELRREGKKIEHLGELSEEEARHLIQEAK